MTKNLGKALDLHTQNKKLHTAAEGTMYNVKSKYNVITKESLEGLRY